MTDLNKPHVVYDAKTDNEHEQVMPVATLRIVKQGYELQQEIDEATKRLKKVKEKLKTDFGAGQILVVPGLTRVPISKVVTVAIGDDDKLLAMTEDDDNQYCTMEIKHKPTQVYKDMVLNPEGEYEELIAGTAKITERTDIKFLAGK